MTEHDIADNNPPPKPRRLGPPWWLLGLLGAMATAIGVFLGTDLFSDHAFANLVSLGLAIIAVAMLVLWFALASGYRKRLRMSVLIASVAGVAAFVGLFRLDHFSGEMRPVFAYRFSAKPDNLLESPAAEGDDDERRFFPVPRTGAECVGPRRQAGP